jgi:hypothetical protein
VTHPDFHNTARVKTFMDFMPVSLVSDKDFLESPSANA